MSLSTLSCLSLKYSNSVKKYNIFIHFQVTFKDDIRAKLIMEAVEPLKHKRLGREVTNFDKTVWGRKSIEVVKKGNLEKVCNS